jgi:histidinol-phosphatase (PHP family)
MWFDNHVHMEHGPYTPLEYPVSWLEQFLDVGRSRGVTGLGIVEHAYRFTEAAGLLPGEWARQRCRYPLAGYTAFLDAIRGSYPMAAGLEMDFVPANEEGIRAFLGRYSWDFVLGSIHFLDDFGLDVSEMQGHYFQRTPEEIWTQYYDYSMRAAASGLFQAITHPDLPKIYGFEKPPEEFLIPLYQRFVEVLADTGVALEINTAGLRRPVKEIYPHPTLLSLAAQSHVAVSFASDAHEPENVGLYFVEAQQLAHEAGFREISFFGPQGTGHITIS